LIIDAEAAKFIDDTQDLDRLPIFGRLKNEVPAPNIIWDSGTSGRSRGTAAATRLLLRLMAPQAFSAADALHFLTVHPPTITSESLSDEAITISGIILG